MCPAFVILGIDIIILPSTPSKLDIQPDIHLLSFFPKKSWEGMWRLQASKSLRSCSISYQSVYQPVGVRVDVHRGCSDHIIYLGR